MTRRTKNAPLPPHRERRGPFSIRVKREDQPMNEQMDHTTTAVIYARFSCSKQREESIEDQERVCREYAARQGWDVAKVYSDRAMSATTDARPSFRRMLADAEKGGFERVIVYKLDRFARNRYDAAINRSKLKKCGVELVSATEAIGDGPESVLVEALIEGFAEYYSRQLSENVKRGIEGNAMKCKANGRTVYGYDIDADGRYVVNEEEAAVVRRMYDAVAQGGTLADAMAAVAGTRTRSGASWSKSSVCRILHSERYAGVYEYAGHRVEGGVPAIVDAKTWDAVNSHFTERPRRKRGGEVYLLSGKMFDEDGSPFWGMSAMGRNGVRYCYYRCPKTGAAFSRDDVDVKVAAAVSVYLEDEAAVDQVTDLIISGQDKMNAAQLDICRALEEDLAAAQREYERVIDTVARMGLDASLEGRITRLRAQIEEARASLDYERSQLPVITRDMVRYWVWQISQAPDTETLISSFVTDVTVYKDNSFCISLTLDELGKPQERNSKPPAQAGGLRKTRMVQPLVRSAGMPGIVAIPGGFAVLVAA